MFQGPWPRKSPAQSPRGGHEPHEPQVPAEVVVRKPSERSDSHPVGGGETERIYWWDLWGNFFLVGLGPKVA